MALDRDFVAFAVLLAAGMLGARAAQAAPGVMSDPRAGSTGPTPNFTWDELTRTGTGLPNEAGPAELENLAHLARTILEPLRAGIGNRPIYVTSGFRTPEVNAAIPGSVSDSQHLLGQAADIRSGYASAETLAAYAMELGLPYDQLIWYHPARGGHVHVSAVPAGAPRREVRYYPETGRSVLVEGASA